MINWPVYEETLGLWPIVRSVNKHSVSEETPCLWSNARSVLEWPELGRPGAWKNRPVCEKNARSDLQIDLSRPGIARSIPEKKTLHWCFRRVNRKKLCGFEASSIYKKIKFFHFRYWPPQISGRTVKTKRKSLIYMMFILSGNNTSTIEYIFRLLKHNLEFWPKLFLERRSHYPSHDVKWKL